MRGSAGSPNAAAPALRRFAASLRWWRAAGSALSAAFRWGLLLALPLVACAWASPDAAVYASILVAVLLGVVALLTGLASWWRSRRRPANWRADGAGGAFHDELLTWLELDRRGASAVRAGMFGWLEREVHARLQPHRRDAARAAARLHLGRWRWLCVPLAMLLLAWLLSGWFVPPWQGAVGGGESRPSGASSGVGEVAVGAVGVRVEPAAPAPSEDDRPDAPDAPASLDAPPADDGQAPPADESEDPPPLLDLPDDRRFVLPDYIGDGPTRRARMHVAELAQPGPVGAPARAARSRGDAFRARPEAPVDAVEFDRALEKAQRSRHVPAAERAIVRRFFESLQRQGKR